MNNFASMFSKRKTQRKHTSHTSNTHHTHQHKHTFMYGKVYTCPHCGRKGHLAKFCYAKLNMQNKNTWVQESTNPIGPKKIWVPKNTTNLFDTSVSSSSKTQGEMMLGCWIHEAKRINHHLHHYQEAPILEIALCLVTSPLEYFLSSQIFACIE